VTRFADPGTTISESEAYEASQSFVKILNAINYYMEIKIINLLWNNNHNGLQVFGVLNKIVGFNQISDVFGDE
jgi:hypothetical protein